MPRPVPGVELPEARERELQRGSVNHRGWATETKQSALKFVFFFFLSPQSDLIKCHSGVQLQPRVYTDIFAWIKIIFPYTFI